MVCGRKVEFIYIRKAITTMSGAIEYSIIYNDMQAKICKLGYVLYNMQWGKESS